MTERNYGSVDSESDFDAIGTIRVLSANATPFCRVCMRAAPEEKLVPPRSVSALANMLQLNNLWKRVRTLARVNASVRRVRPRRMRTTEILLVTSNEMTAQPQPPAPCASPPAPSLPTWRQDMQTVFIDDDDDDAVPPAPSRGPAPLPPPAQSLVFAPTLPPAPSAVCVAPFAMPVVSQLTVPPQSIAFTQLPQSAPVNILMSNGGVPHVLLLPNPGVNVMSPNPAPSTTVTFDVDAIQRVNEEMVLQEALITMNQDLHEHKRKRMNFAKETRDNTSDVPLCVVANVVGGFKSPPRNADAKETKRPVCNRDEVDRKEIKQPMHNEEKADWMEMKRPVRNGEKVGLEETKQPVRNGEKVDWEDKIPMDVISFMVSEKLLYEY
ncbi:uncharacterized protein LOC113234260 [Hyposmocoma kahamanoa]|uniref:uncharacterized protein LOC113234260 n=1 Tax=Hyposmocoma kahamanoa TaxID=1477025 RepID=UPI000E6DA29A|nr:uncharacterized protein LOC113234260 [Hyposmocoma kahamanoa]